MVTLTVDGEPCTLPRDASVAAAVLQRGSIARTSARFGNPRAPYCMIGVCFECRVEIDGVRDCLACLVLAEDGMKVRSQHEIQPSSGAG